MIRTLLFLLVGIFFTTINVSNVSEVFAEPNPGNPTEIVINDSGEIKKSQHLTKPTFGLSHETNETVVEDGFKFNDKSFFINNSYHTPFAEQSVIVGEVNSFEIKTYATKGLRVQEFLFGIPNVGEAHLAELGIEIWFSYGGEIENIKAVQNSNVIDTTNIIATHEKTKCKPSDTEKNCDTTRVSITFLETLKDKVMALKAIDFEKRYQITYLNEGFDLSDESLNPMNTVMIPSTIKGEGLIQVTQTQKYSPFWMTKDGRLFEKNDFGSFSRINQSFERFQDIGEPRTRLHSGFAEIIAFEQERAKAVFNSSELISELPDYFSYSLPEIHERITPELKAKMLEEEQKCLEYLKESNKQARF